jgi:predicted neutral ceramidase superfamily lipid hydrolase
MSVERITRRYYRRLSLLPRKRFLIAIYVSLISLAGIANAKHYSVEGFSASISAYFLLGCVLTFMYSPLMLTKLFNFKRVLGLSLVTFATSLIAELILYRLAGLRGLGLVVTSGFVLVILSAFTSVIHALAVSLTIPILTLAVVNKVFFEQSLSYAQLVSALIVEFASVVLGILLLRYIDNKGRQLSGVSPIVALRAFLNTWFTGEPESLEALFNHIGSQKSVEVKCLVIKREVKPNIVMVFPRIHFGPFNNIGSSRFIHYVDNFSEPDFKAFTFHTAGSHEHNLANNKDAERIAREVVTKARNSLNDSLKEYLCEPYRIKLSDGWEALTLRGEDFMTPFIINKSLGNDDIPYNAWDYLSKHPKAPANVMLVDAHSCKGDKVKELEELKNLLDRVAEAYGCSEPSKFLVGYGEAAVTKACVGLCNPRIKALSMRVGDRRYGLIYIYGNNVDKNFRLKLDNVIREKTNLTDFEVVTPDDHSCAASLKESPYEVVNECDGLVEAVLESLKKASENEVPASYKIVNLELSDVRVVGERVFTLIENLHVLAKKTEVGILMILAVLNTLMPLLYVFFATYLTW